MFRKVSGPSRGYIGSYIDRSIGGAYKYAYEFPPPREVDRELYPHILYVNL